MATGRGLEQRKMFAAYTGQLEGGCATLQDMTVHGIPQINTKRAVRSGLISQRGNLDHIWRRYVSLCVHGSAGFNRLAVAAYAIDYDFTLYSNFSYFLNDPVLGDELEQRDQRRITG